MGERQAEHYDILIIGARVAGATLALLLGERGHRVLLIDRDQFPSDTLSTHFINYWNIPALARLGVLDDIEGAGFRRIIRARTCVDDCCFEGPIGPEGAYALAPRRDVLDALLIDHAVRHGHVEFCQRTHADGLIHEGETIVGATIASAGGQQRAVRARVVDGADGKFSKVAKWVNATHYHGGLPLRPGYYGHYEGVGPLPETAVEVFFDHERIGFIFPMQPGLDCLALELKPEEFTTFRSNPQEPFETCFRALPGMASRLRNARLAGKMMGFPGVPNLFRKPYGPGWALTGDAGCVKDPSTGLGIGDAIHQSIWLADALDATLHGADWEPTMATYQRQRDRALLPSFRATIAFTRQRDPNANQLAWMRAVLSSAATVRDLSTHLPPKMRDVLSASWRTQAATLAREFGADNVPASEPASADR